MELVLQRPKRKEGVKKFNILYVDDEPVNLRTFQHAFQRYYNVFTAHNGFDAIDVLNEKNVDLIITDQQMPMMSGVDLLAKIVPKYPSIVRMIMTGFSDIGAIIRAVNEFGLDKYLVKPWDRDQLKTEIDIALVRKYKNEQEKSGQDQLDDVVLNSSFLPKEKDLKESFDDGFVLYDQHSENNHGYWFGEVDSQSIVAYYNGTQCKLSPLVLNSFININLTQLIYKESVLRPSQLIIKLIERVRSRFSNQFNGIGELDLGIVIFDKKENKMTYSGSGQDIYYLDKEGELRSIQGEQASINFNKSIKLSNKKVDLSTMLYLVSKGMVNQKIPADGSEVEEMNFLHLLKESSSLKLEEQAKKLIQN